MKQNTVKTGLCICWITGFVLLLAASFLVCAIIYVRPLLIAGMLVILVSAMCWLWTPESFEISSGDLQLTVSRRFGRKQFGPAVRCHRLAARLNCIKLCGNGGLFAVTGLFWSRKHGRFRIYSTSANYKDLVMVETAGRKIVISPESPDAWMADCALLKIPGSPDDA